MDQQVATPEQTSLATLPPAQRAAIALNVDIYKEQIAAKVKESADITQVLDPAGREQAHRIGMVLLKLRTGIKARGEEVRKDATVFSRAVIAAEKELVDLVTPEETRVIGLRDAYDAKVRAEKDEADRLEAARVENLKTMLGNLRAEVLACYSKSAAEIAERMGQLRDDAAGDTEERWAEYLPRAKEVRAEVLGQMATQYDARFADEMAAERTRQAAAAEAERVAAQAEANRLAALEIERQRQELAAAQAKIDEENAERARAEEVERQRVAAEAKRQMEAQQAELNAQRAAQQEAANKLAREQKEFQDKIDAQAAADELRKRDLAEAERIASLQVERVAAILDGAQEPMPSQETLFGAADVAMVVDHITLPVMQARPVDVVITGDADTISVFQQVLRELMTTRDAAFIRGLVEEELAGYGAMLAEEE